MSLTTRILVVFVLIASLAWRLLFEPVIDRVERQYLEAAEEPMVETAEILAAIVSQHLQQDGELPKHLSQAFQQVDQRQLEARIYSLVKTSVDMEITITDAKGIVIFDSRGPEYVGTNQSSFFDISRTLLGRYGARSTQTDEKDESSSVMHVGAPILVDGQIAGVLSVSKPQQSMLIFIKETRALLRTIAVMGIIGFLIIGILLSRWVTHPLRSLTRHAVAVAGGSRQSAPKLPGRHLRQLAESLEAMRDALEDRNYVENYVQTLTHEMKSPVSAIRGAAEILGDDPEVEHRRDFARNILAESERLQRLIERLLALAALENRKRLETPQRVDLSELTGRIVEEIQAHSTPDAATIRFTHQPDAWVKGEEFLLETAIRNLLSNAQEFTPDEDGQIEVIIRLDGKWVQLEVLDNGPGIPDYAQQRVFDHFYSLPRPRSGHKSSGLGLCFVRECAQLHSGSADIRNREEGGAMASLKLPLSERVSLSSSS